MQLAYPRCLKNATPREKRMYLYGALSRTLPEDKRRSIWISFLLRHTLWVQRGKCVHPQKAEQNRQRKFMAAMRKDPYVQKAIEEIETGATDDPADWWKR